MIEISGGCYEQSAMMTGQGTSTKQREAYFFEFAESVRRQVSTKSKAAFMLTGGFRSASVMLQALRAGIVDIIGLGRPFVMQPKEISKLIHLNEEDFLKFKFADAKLNTGVKDFDAGFSVPIKYYINITSYSSCEIGLQNIWHQDQIRRIATGLEALSTTSLSCLQQLLNAQESYPTTK